MMTSGQPILVGHHSEKRHRRLIEKANNDIKKSIELSDKSQYYEDKARSAENNNAIYNDDPKAISKLKDKLERLENERNSIKAREHSKWELTSIGQIYEKLNYELKDLKNRNNLCFQI